MDASKLEETTAEILGQIQASVAEYVRTMNEAGALRRREADEAHRQQDQAIAAINAVESRGKAILERHTELVVTIGKEWVSLVNRGAKDVAIAQARECASAAMLMFEGRAEKYAERIRDMFSSIEEVVGRHRAINRSLAWKTVTISGALGMTLTMLLVALVWWRGNIAIRDRIAQYATLEISAARIRQDLSRADVRGCEIAGQRRLCIRIDEGAPSVVDEKNHATYAVPFGY